MEALKRFGSPTAFEALVDDYDAARPTYPDAMYDGIAGLAGGTVLELGTGTGLATPALLSRAASVVCSDLGPKMLRRAVDKLAVPAVVARAEALPFADASFDLVCGAQMWHWVDGPGAAREVTRVLRPGGHLALWWNEIDPAAGTPAFRAAWDTQQDRLEAGNSGYSRGYRERDYAADLAEWFAPGPPSIVPWQRRIGLDLYERWLRSKSYVQELADVDGFVAAERASMTAAFPDGVVVEPFVVRLWVLARR